MRLGKYLIRTIILVSITLFAALIACIIVVFIIETGPAEEIRVKFVNAANETSRMKWVGKMFLSEEEFNSIVNSAQMLELEEGEKSDISLVEIDQSNHTEEIEYFEITESAFKGYLLIIHDPSKVFCGTIPDFGEFQGMTASEVIDLYNENGYDIVGGVNGGDFIDLGPGNSFTAQPLGAVISEGKVVYAENGYDFNYRLSGFTNENIFVVGIMTLDEAIEMGIRDAIYCVHDTGPFLIKDGKVLLEEVSDSSIYGGGTNPRTAIGQRADGAVLILVTDGRQANSFGATFKDLALTMLEYGAINASAMDGGTSSQMILNGEIKNNPYSPTGPRRCPTFWLIKE